MPASRWLRDPLQGWQASRGISGSFRLDSVAALPWNQWQLSCGTGGSFAVESVAGLAWNTQQTAQHDFEPIIGTIEALDGLPRRGSPRPKPVAHPGFDVYPAMSTPGHNGTEPARADPAQAETLPVAVGGKMVVQQGGKTPPLPLLQSERHIVHSLRDDGRYLVHAQSLAPSPMYLQIWANRKHYAFIA